VKWPISKPRSRDRHGRWPVGSRESRAPYVAKGATCRLPTAHGVFDAVAFTAFPSRTDHMALVLGNVNGATDVLVRVHSECLTGEVFHSLRCDCGPQLGESLRRIDQAGAGVLVYVRGHEGRGIGLARKLAAYELQDSGCDTVEANIALGLPVDQRDYGDAARILAELGVVSLRLLTNNPAKCAQLALAGIRISGRVPLEMPARAENVHYLQTKRTRMGHLLRCAE
jgi:3,4-dihydroxy 2-butanone 4-phosphate synthase/GTP cyclohydrolase II